MRSIERTGDTIETSPRKASGKRQCSLCRQTKEHHEFYGGWQCKTCLQSKMRERHRRRSADPAYREKHNSYCRAHYGQNKAMHAERRKARYRERRDAVLAHYGTSCACCGEARREFLAIDHVNNDGAQHRREIGNTSLTHWLVRRGFPKGFQTLCHNCNSAKAVYGACPHQREKLKCAS